MAQHVGMTVLHPGGFQATNELLDRCEIKTSSKVIDIACGKGTTTCLIAESFGCKVTGIDISETLVKQAKEISKRSKARERIDFKVGDAMDLPFNDDSFDAAVSQAMLVLVPDQKRTIEEAIRVIKPGGYAGWIELCWKKEPSEEFMKGVSEVICAYCMLNVHTYEGWEEVFRSAGAKDISIFRYDMQFNGLSGMLKDEGIKNSLRIMMRYLFQKPVRNRMRTMDRFFKDHPEYFGYGIFVVRK